MALLKATMQITHVYPRGNRGLSKLCEHIAPFDHTGK